jgi:hypothetical protein
MSLDAKGFIRARVMIDYLDGDGEKYTHTLSLSAWVTDIRGEILDDPNVVWGFRAIYSSTTVESKDPELSSSVDHPTYYGGDVVYEAIKVIEAWGLTFNTGNAAKYLCRAGKKGGSSQHIEDLEKARRYLDFEIARLKKTWLTKEDI